MKIKCKIKHICYYGPLITDKIINETIYHSIYWLQNIFPSVKHDGQLESQNNSDVIYHIETMSLMMIHYFYIEISDKDYQKIKLTNVQFLNKLFNEAITLHYERLTENGKKYNVGFHMSLTMHEQKI